MTKPDTIYYGLAETIHAEIGGTTVIYKGKYLIAPTGNAEFDCDVLESKKELKIALGEWRKWFPEAKFVSI
jgi:hypothetical protein